MNSTHKKLLSMTMFLFCLGIETHAQRYYSIVFDNLPRDMQLYAREDNNLAEVPITGVIEIPGWDHMSVVTYRNKERYGYNKSTLVYGGKSSTNFDLRPKIKAEMADYDFEVYACRLTDSVLITKKTEIVGGDFYVISGQSNASATIFGSWTSKYARTIARIPDSNPSIGAADTLWIPSAWSWTYVGAWGLELQRSVLESEGIPTCVINGALPGKKVSEFLLRDETNPSSPNSLYGYLLYRVNLAKPKRIRAFFWVHGEQEIFEYLNNYAPEYDQLFKFWLKDYPTVDQFIITQTNMILLNNDSKVQVGGVIRDFLRRTKYLYPKTDHFTPIAIPGYEGVHYNRAGYEEFGRRLFRFLRPTVYKSADSDNVSSPDVKKVFYSNDKKSEITLTFDEGQVLKWSADSTIKGRNGQPLVTSLKNYFYLDGDETKTQVASGKSDGNRVILTLKEPVNATKMNYLPSFITDNLPLSEPAYYNIGFFTGPFLVNKRGLGAFSFNDVAIAAGLPSISLTAAKSTFNTVNLTWSESVGAVGFILEKRKPGSTSFVAIKQFDSQTRTYDDKDVQLSAVYTYRVKAISDKSESPFAESTIDLTPILAVEPSSANVFWQTYPNPASNVLKIDFQKPSSGQLQIYSAGGQRYHSTRIKAVKSMEVNISAWPSGTYLLHMKNSDGATATKKIVKQ